MNNHQLMDLALNHLFDAPMERVEVRDAESFIHAIGSNKHIILHAGTYHIDDVADCWLSNVQWREEFDGKTVLIQAVTNLKIEAQGHVEIVTRAAYANVLEFHECTGLAIEGIYFGHAVKKGTCTNGVLGFLACKNTYVRHCDLYGCGTEAINIRQCFNLIVTDTTMRECTYGIMSIRDSQDLLFDTNVIKDNQEYWGVKINHCRNINFRLCSFFNNRVTGNLIEYISSSELNFEDCVYRDNKCDNIGEPEPNGK